MEAGRESSVMKIKLDYLLLKRGFAKIFNLTIKHYNTNLFFNLIFDIILGLISNFATKLQ